VSGRDTAPPAPDSGVVVVERVLPAAPEAVFAAWTDPEVLHDWMSPSGHAEANVDVREGGRFSIAMVGEGERIEHTGEYLVVDAPRRLSFTWTSSYAPNSVVTVTFAPHDDGTLVRLTHERMPADRAPSHEGGWGTMLERLGSLLRYRERPA
jgi:uncharacterized protein YndB with AHSA1/START domain